MKSLIGSLFLFAAIAPRSFAGGPAPADLAALLAEAESNHPELRAMASRRDAASRVPSQMEAPLDPWLTMAYTNESLDSFTLGDSPDSSLAFTWTQEVPYPGKRRLAGEVALGELTTAERGIEVARARIRAEVKRLYFDLFRIDRTTAVLDETRKVLASLVASSRARYESGEGTLENVLKAQTEVSAIEADLVMNRTERLAIEAGLAVAVGRSAGAAFGPALDLPPIVSPDRASIEERVAVSSPEVRALEAMVETEARRLELARRNARPDLMYSVGYANRGDLDPMIMGMVGVRLPLYRGRKQAEAVAQTEHDLEAARYDVDSTRNQALGRARELLARVERASALAPLYVDGLIPQARSTLAAATGSYAAGRTEFLALLDDATKVLRYELEYVRQRVDALQALAEIEELTGAELIQTSTGESHD